MKTLLPFQLEGRNFLTTHRSALLGDDMGLGKTFQVVDSCRELGAQKVLVVCPASVKYSWEQEFRDEYPALKNRFVVRSRSCVVPDAADLVVVNYDLLIDKRILAQLRKRKWSVVVMDEAHYLKNLDSKRTRAMLKVPYGLVFKGYYQWALTGTPVLNRPIELFPLLTAIGKEHIKPYDNWYGYTQRYCDAFQENGGWNVRGASNIMDLRKRLSGFMLRRLKSDVLPDLPPKTIQTILLECAPGYAVEDALHGRDEETLLGLFSTLRQDTALAKLDQCMSHIDDVLTEKSKIVVFFYHKLVLEKLRARYPKSRVITGGMSGEQKQFEKESFLNGTDEVIFIQFVAGGVGLDGLQRAADTCIFVEISWTPGDLSQAMDRLHRMGQQNPVLVQFLVMRDSLEDLMLGTVLKKTNTVVDPLMGGKECDG